MGATMTNEVIELARRAVACPDWRWMPGMLAWSKKHCVDLQGRDLGEIEDSMRVQEVETGCLIGLPTGKSIAYSWSDFDLLPDLTDPATIGCLLALVRNVLGEPLASVEVRQPGDLGCRACVRVPVGSEGWRVVQWWCASQDPHYSEAAALVAALEAAGGQ